MKAAIMRLPFCYICALFLFASLLIAGCGSSGGGLAPSEGGESLVYTGLSDPAQITASNAEALATSALAGGSFNAGGMTKSQAQSSSLGSKEALTFTISKSIKQAGHWTQSPASSAKVSAGSNGEGDGSCAEGPGKFEYSLTYLTNYSAKAVFTYSDYCSRGTRLNGKANIVLLYDSQTLMLSEFTISLDGLQIESNTISSAASGSIKIYKILDSSYNETVNILQMDAASGKIFKTENLETVNTIGSNYFDMTVTGGIFYHPDYGYVRMSTSAPIRYFDDAGRPYSGSLEITGSLSSNALLSFYSLDSYRVQTDEDGNGVYDRDSGMRGWGGASPTDSLAPVANGGADQDADVGEAVALDGSGSVSYQDGAFLTYKWSIVSAPEGSTAALANQNTASPSFTPEMGGTYIIALKVNDGSSESQADHVTVTVHNDTIFAPYNIISSFNGADAVAVGDLNDDGRDDVALVAGLSHDPTNKYLHVFLQNASGGLDPAVKYETNGTSTESVVSGDFNNDGRTDLIVGTGSGIIVFLQSDSGGLVSSAFHATQNGYKLSTGDFNNDGSLDVAGLGSITNEVHVFLQSSSGTFSEPIIYTMSQAYFELIETGDVNGDGLADLVIMCGHGCKVFATLLQNSEGTFDTPVYYQQNWYSEGLAVGDVNGENRDDIFITFSAKVGVFLQNGQGEISQQVDYSALYSPGPVLIEDVTRDGKNEVMVLHFDNALDVYLQGDSWYFGGSKKYTLPIGSSRYDAKALAAGDLNSDGRKDIAIADNANGLVVLYNIY